MLSQVAVFATVTEYVLDTMYSRNHRRPFIFLVMPGDGSCAIILTDIVQECFAHESWEGLSEYLESAMLGFTVCEFVSME